jgi:hypothetical protein
MEEYLIQLREEAVESLTYTTQQANKKIVDLEPRIEKMEIQAVGQSHQTDAGGKTTMSASSSIPGQKVYPKFLFPGISSFWISGSLLCKLEYRPLCNSDNHAVSRFLF